MLQTADVKYCTELNKLEPFSCLHNIFFTKIIIDYSFYNSILDQFCFMVQIGDVAKDAAC